MSKIFIDQIGRKVEIEDSVHTIVSLVPSITELLYHLNLGEKIVGVTKFCVHPKIKSNTPSKVGGTKNFRFDEIERIHPDLILANKEENYKEGIERLEMKFPVWVSDVNDLGEAMDMINQIGQMTDRSVVTEKLIVSLNEKWKNVKNIAAGSVLYFIWDDPKMVIGSNTFVDYVLNHLGLTNVAGNLNRYPKLSTEQLSQLDPDFVFLSSEPFLYKQKHMSNYLDLFPKSKIFLVDGEMFSWYGSRMLYAPDYFFNLINQEI